MDTCGAPASCLGAAAPIGRHWPVDDGLGTQARPGVIEAKRSSRWRDLPGASRARRPGWLAAGSAHGAGARILACG